MTISFYDTNAGAYFEQTVGADVSHLRARFLAHVPSGGRILDAGCGSGRDAKAFKEAGYSVVAFDGSSQMAERARAFTGLPVLHMVFADVSWRREFDGIWASASLLHLPRGDLPAAFAKLCTALVPGGALYVSLKKGEGEQAIDGRLFTYVERADLIDIAASASMDVVDIWETADVRPNRSDQWFNAVLSKPASAY